MLAYMTSGMEVSRWLAAAGQPAIPTLVKHVRQGHDFQDVYQQLEAKKQP
jgi:hypothetical protein